MSGDEHIQLPSDIRGWFDAIVLADAERRDLLLKKLSAQPDNIESRVRELLLADAKSAPVPSLPGEVALAIDSQKAGSIQRGDRFGRYIVLEQLGEGGFGTVFKAEQRDPVQRTVAMKVIKAGLDTKEVIARFSSERQALSRMEHPNIARVLDAGSTEMGRPYFVMEYVPGLPITEYADREKLSVEERLDLFCQVCRAVAHAHQKAIIHRDIKPSNVLAYTLDGCPVVKVIDFGIAKALTSDRLTNLTFNTVGGAAIGSYASMSPEQAEGSTDIDTRADVYSLGVLLYELLSGSPPFKFRGSTASANDEAMRVIREVDPPAPSAVLTSLDPESGTAVAEARQLHRDSLKKVLKNELEWIPLKAMRKDRSRRYAGVEQLQIDVENYLAGRPLIAGPESQAYRINKVVRRNAVALSIVVVFFLTVMAGAVTAMILYFEATEAQSKLKVALSVEEELRVKEQQGRERAEAESARANEAERVASEINEYTRAMLLGGEQQLVSGGLPSVADIVSELEGRFPHDVVVQSGALINHAIFLRGKTSFSERISRIFLDEPPVASELFRAAIHNLDGVDGVEAAAQRDEARRRLFESMKELVQIRDGDPSERLDLLQDLIKYQEALGEEGDLRRAELLVERALLVMKADQPSLDMKIDSLEQEILDLVTPAEAVRLLSSVRPIELRGYLLQKRWEDAVAIVHRRLKNEGDVYRFGDYHQDLHDIAQGLVPQDPKRAKLILWDYFEMEGGRLIASNVFLLYGLCSEAERLQILESLSHRVEDSVFDVSLRDCGTHSIVGVLGELYLVEERYQDMVELFSSHSVRLAMGVHESRDTYLFAKGLAAIGDHESSMQRLLDVLEAEGLGRDHRYWSYRGLRIPEVDSSHLLAAAALNSSLDSLMKGRGDQYRAITADSVRLMLRHNFARGESIQSPDSLGFTYFDSIGLNNEGDVLREPGSRPVLRGAEEKVRGIVVQVDGVEMVIETVDLSGEKTKVKFVFRDSLARRLQASFRSNFEILMTGALIEYPANIAIASTEVGSITEITVDDLEKFVVLPFSELVQSRAPSAVFAWPIDPQVRGLSSGQPLEEFLSVSVRTLSDLYQQQIHDAHWNRHAGIQNLDALFAGWSEALYAERGGRDQVTVQIDTELRRLEGLAWWRAAFGEEGVGLSKPVVASDPAAISKCRRHGLPSRIEGVVASVGPSLTGSGSLYIEFEGGQKSGLFVRLQRADSLEWLASKCEDNDLSSLVGRRVILIAAIESRYGRPVVDLDLPLNSIEVLDSVRKHDNEKLISSSVSAIDATDERRVAEALRHHVTIQGPVRSTRWIMSQSMMLMTVGTDDHRVVVIVPAGVVESVFRSSGGEPEVGMPLTASGLLQLWGGQVAMRIDDASMLNGVPDSTTILEPTEKGD